MLPTDYRIALQQWITMSYYTCLLIIFFLYASNSFQAQTVANAIDHVGISVDIDSILSYARVALNNMGLGHILIFTYETEFQRLLVCYCNKPL